VADAVAEREDLAVRDIQPPLHGQRLAFTQPVVRVVAADVSQHGGPVGPLRISSWYSPSVRPWPSGFATKFEIDAGVELLTASPRSVKPMIKSSR